MNSELEITFLMCVGNPGLPSTPAAPGSRQPAWDDSWPPAPPGPGYRQAQRGRLLAADTCFPGRQFTAKAEEAPCQRPGEGAKSWRKSWRAEVRGGARGGKLRTGKTQKEEGRDGRASPWESDNAPLSRTSK